MNGVKTVALVEQPEDALPMVPEVTMFERLAKDPTVPVEKLEKLIELQERVMRHQAKAAFDSAFSAMQEELPIIDERGQIVVGDVVRSRYARHEDIQEAVKPILAKHGFSINHKNKHLERGVLLIIGVLRHRGGHSEEDEFECPPDTSGSKNNIQALGSTREYGRRYTTISLLNIVTRGVDDDGKKAGLKDAPKTPTGFEEWLIDLQATADNGFEVLSRTFKASKEEFRLHLKAIDPQEIERLKAKARAVDEKAKARTVQS